MTEFNIAVPPSIPPEMRSAPALEPFDEAAAVARMNHVAHLRSLHENAAKGNAAAVAAVQQPHVREAWQAYQARVAIYAGVKSPPPTVAPPPAATAPRTPRPTVPAPVQPSPALAGLARRSGLLTQLLGAQPTPTAPTDSLV